MKTGSLTFELQISDLDCGHPIEDATRFQFARPANAAVDELDREAGRLPLAGGRNVRPSRGIDSRCSRILPILSEKHVQPGEDHRASANDHARGDRSPQRVSPCELPDGEHRREDGDDDRRRNHPERDRDDAPVIEVTAPVSGDLFRHATILRPRWAHTAGRGRHLVCNHE